MSMEAFTFCPRKWLWTLGCDIGIRKNNIQQKSEQAEDQYVPQEEDLKASLH